MVEQERTPTPSMATKIAERMAQQCIEEGGSPVEYRMAARERAQASAQWFERLLRPMRLMRSVRRLAPFPESPDRAAIGEDVNLVFTSHFGELEEVSR